MNRFWKVAKLALMLALVAALSFAGTALATTDSAPAEAQTDGSDTLTLVGSVTSGGIGAGGAAGGGGGGASGGAGGADILVAQY